MNKFVEFLDHIPFAFHRIEAHRVYEQAGVGTLPRHFGSRMMTVEQMIILLWLWQKNKNDRHDEKFWKKGCRGYRLYFPR
jgi:hypothetical protein